jgi:hypothetical protein
VYDSLEASLRVIGGEAGGAHEAESSRELGPWKLTVMMATATAMDFTVTFGVDSCDEG